MTPPNPDASLRAPLLVALDIMDPLQCIAEASKISSTCLNLSGNCLSVDTCALLAKRLARGHSFTELSLADCLIGDEGWCIGYMYMVCAFVDEIEYHTSVITV